MGRKTTTNIPGDRKYDPTEAVLARGIAQAPDVDPPSSLLAGVMRSIEPKRLPWWRKLVMWFTSPTCVTLTPARVLPVGAAVAAAFLAVVIFNETPQQAPAPQVASLPKAAANGEKVVFSLNLPGAEQVSLIGDFNRWNPGGYDMRYDKARGVWTISVDLDRGRHEYAFLINGQHVVPDPNSILSVSDGFGNTNSILILDGKGGGHAQRT